MPQGSQQTTPRGARDTQDGQGQEHQANPSAQARPGQATWGREAPDRDRTHPGTQGDRGAQDKTKTSKTRPRRPRHQSPSRPRHHSCPRSPSHPKRTSQEHLSRTRQTTPQPTPTLAWGIEHNLVFLDGKPLHMILNDGSNLINIMYKRQDRTPTRLESMRTAMRRSTQKPRRWDINTPQCRGPKNQARPPLLTRRAGN